MSLKHVLLRGHRLPYLAFAAAVLLLIPTSQSALAQSSKFADSQVSEMQQVVSSNPGVFGGLFGDPATNMVTILVAPVSVPAERAAAMAKLALIGSSSDPFLASGPKHWSIQYAAARESLSDLDRTFQRIDLAEPWISDAGDSLVRWGIDVRRQVVVIGVRDITPVLKLDADRAFGTEAVLEVDRNTYRDTSRSADSQPYWGGDGIVDSNGDQCTAGFVAWNGDYGMLTAGHCYSSNTIVYQGYFDFWGNHTTGKMGKVTRRSWGDHLMDAEFLDASVLGTSVQDYVYTSNTYGLQVKSSGTAFVGQGLCLDGFVTGQNCNGVVQQTEQCVWIFFNTTCHLDQITASSTLAQGGDSGGPVYSFSGSGVQAYGLIVGANGDGTSALFTPILDPTGGLSVALVVN